MKNDILILITETSERENSSRGILYAFDSSGLIEAEVLAKVIGQVSIVAESASEIQARKIGLEPQIASTFKSEESFHKFTLELCRELGARRVRVLSRHEFNSLCEECLSVQDFHHKLEGVGEVIENFEQTQKNNFFKKLFH